MDKLTTDAAVHQALATVQQYLSDTIAPLLAADSVALLLNRPAQLVAQEIVEWASGQFQGKGTTASFSDYLFHALKKLHDMGGLKLVPEARLSSYIGQLKLLLFGCCPVDERDMLAEMLSHLEQADTALTPTVAFIHRQVESGEAASAGGKDGTPEAANIRAMARRLSILWKRLIEESGEPERASPAASEKREGLVSQVLATAATAAQSDQEFRRIQEKLGTLGIDSGTDEIFRVLSRSLPGWSVPAMPESEGGKGTARQNATVEAMRQIMLLAEDGFEGCKRFQDMIQAASEQFNTGSLARASTMFELANSVATEGSLDAGAVASIRRTAHESLDLNRLRTYSKQPEKHHLLRKVLSFFDEFKVEGLLDGLQHELKRDRRRLILSLLVVHGDAARRAALERLRGLVAGAPIAGDWYFPRNLTCLLHDIPRPDDVLPDEEIEIMASLLKLSLPPPLVREAIANVGQIKHGRAERLLIELADELEHLLLGPRPAGGDTAQLISLLDRTIFALAHFGTANAYRVVVAHGLGRKEELGDTLSRLSYLYGQDLSTDEKSCARLLKVLKRKIPRRVFGVMIQKDEQTLLHLIKALSSTPAPAVQQVLESIATRFADEDFGKAAAKALEEFSAAGARAEVSTERLIGDLELFSLPDLLQQLALLQLTGTLTLKDARVETAGTISLIGGRMQSAGAGRLQGAEAVYQILERPFAGTFVFHGRREKVRQVQTEGPQLLDLTSVLFEGMRRYDELQRARAIVPDSAFLKPTGADPVPRPPEDDAALFEQVWKSIGAGASPEKCEAECLSDTYRVRSLLARWVEEDVLSVS